MQYLEEELMKKYERPALETRGDIRSITQGTGVQGIDGLFPLDLGTHS